MAQCMRPLCARVVLPMIQFNYFTTELKTKPGCCNLVSYAMSLVVRVQPSKLD